MSTPGWAVIDYGYINIRTVSNTRRAAIINWLVVQKGMLVESRHTDDEVERMWETMKNQGTANADVMPVTVEIAS